MPAPDGTRLVVPALTGMATRLGVRLGGSMPAPDSLRVWRVQVAAARPL